MDTLFVPLLFALLIVFMLFSMRKQKKRMAEIQEMQQAVATGARVQLTAGLFATVVDASSSDYVDLEIATGIVARFNRQAIVRVLPVDEAAQTYPGALDIPTEIIEDSTHDDVVDGFGSSSDSPTDGSSDDKK